MKHFYTNITLAILLLSLFACSSEPKEEKIVEKKITKQTKATDNLNISFLLDLSDRIDPEKYPNPSMDYYKRDAAYIQSVAEAFKQHLQTKKVRQMNDKIQLYFDPEPFNREVNTISNDLKFHVNKKNASIDLLEKINDAYTTEPEKIYTLAIQDNKYVGSNTWRFFKNKIKDYCIEDGFRNILVIITDGYIYHVNTIIREENLTTYITPQHIRNFKLTSTNWKTKLERDNFGFIPATDNLSNLEILVLGINPDKKSPFEEDIIKTYWSNWLTSMKVKRFEIRNADLPSDMDKLIKDFILSK